MKVVVLLAILVAVVLLVKVTPHYHCWGPDGGLFIAASDMTGECELRGLLVQLRN